MNKPTSDISKLRPGRDDHFKETQENPENQKPKNESEDKPTP